MTKVYLTGLGASSGQTRGKVRIVKNLSNTGQFEDGDILVTEKTDPTMVILMAKAGAIITDTGGLTSHAAIVSREMGIPCVVATKTATKDLKEGQVIQVDGSKGTIRG